MTLLTQSLKKSLTVKREDEDMQKTTTPPMDTPIYIQCSVCQSTRGTIKDEYNIDNLPVTQVVCKMCGHVIVNIEGDNGQ